VVDAAVRDDYIAGVVIQVRIAAGHPRACQGRVRQRLLVATLGLAGLGALLTGCRSPASTADRGTAGPLAGLGLVWTECRTPGYPQPSWGPGCGDELDWSADPSAPPGTTTDELGGRRLAIGPDVYEVTHDDPPNSLLHYVLHENGAPVAALAGRFWAHPPSVDLVNLAAKAAWEFDDEDRQATVIYDGRDLRDAYHLDTVRRPHIVGGKLIAIGSRAGRSFVVYDGRQVGPDFDRVYVYHCCEAAITASVRMGRDAYGFIGARNGAAVGVVISHPGRVPPVGTADD
jgi:hypothetical protein